MICLRRSQLCAWSSWGEFQRSLPASNGSPHCYVKICVEERAILLTWDRWWSSWLLRILACTLLRWGCRTYMPTLVACTLKEHTEQLVRHIMTTDYQLYRHISKPQKLSLSNNLLERQEKMGLLRKLENSTTAISPCVWQDKPDGSCSNNHTGSAKTRNLPITSMIINNLMFAMNLVQINRENGERPRSWHYVKSELAGEGARLPSAFTQFQALLYEYNIFQYAAWP